MPPWGVQAYYAPNASSSPDLTFTSTWGDTRGDYTFFFYDVTGPAPTPFDTYAGGSGNQGTPGNLTVAFKAK
jgi:hypothetical protein